MLAYIYHALHIRPTKRMRTSSIGGYDQDYIHLDDSLNEDAAMMAVEELCLDDKPATRSTQALAATNFKGPLRGGTGNFVNKATYLELKNLESCIQNEKILRQKSLYGLVFPSQMPSFLFCPEY